MYGLVRVFVGRTWQNGTFSHVASHLVLSGLNTLGRFSAIVFTREITVVASCLLYRLFVCVAVLRPSQPNGVMLSAVSLPNHTFTGQA